MSRPQSLHLYKYSRFEHEQNQHDGKYQSSDSSEYEESSDSDCEQPVQHARRGVRMGAPAAHRLADRHGGGSTRHVRGYAAGRDEHVRYRPALGVPAAARSSALFHSHSAANLTSSFETTNTTEEMMQYQDDEEMYAPIQRLPAPPPQRRAISPPAVLRPIRPMTMIQELSPVVPDPVDDLPIVPNLKLQRDWRPQLTSTTTSFQPLLPKTNPHHRKMDSMGVPMTPRSRSHQGRSRRDGGGGGRPLSMQMHNYHHVIDGYGAGRDKEERPESYYAIDDDSESELTDYSARGGGSAVPSTYFRPENFGLPAAVAKNMGTKGIMYLTMTLSGRFLSVAVVKGIYFLDPCQSQICSYVRVETKHRPQRESRKRGPSRETRGSMGPPSSQSFRTRLVPTSNRPTFHETFTFEVDPHNARDQLTISVYAMNADNMQRKRMLGCMTFSMKRMLKKARDAYGNVFVNDENAIQDQAVVNDGGFFLLNPKMGEKKNLPQSKINVHTYYDDQAFCGMTSSSSLNLNSPKMLQHEDWRAASRVSSSIPGYADEMLGGGMRMVSNPNQLDYTTASSSNASHEYRPTHRVTLPSITTTSDASMDDLPASVSPMGPVDYGFLYAEGAPKPPHSRPPPRSPLSKVPSGVRRAASFTFSPTGSLGKHNRRPLEKEQQDKDKEDRKKFTFGPISKTISYIRNKMDTALSTSSLFPAKEEVRQWETSFDSLLNHKYGCALFRQFLKKEFSDENVDFWQECEEFKRMKDGKKSTQQKAHEIYKEYVQEQAPKEVNLDSDTRAATKAAMENGCKTDTFSLAQSRIEQLMAKDSYRRFLKDRLYLDLLDGCEEKEKEQQRKEEQ